MEDHGQMRLDRDPCVIAPFEQIGEDGTHGSIAIAGVGIVRIVLGRVPSSVFDVDMNDMILDVGVVLPGVLFGMRFRFVVMIKFARLRLVAKKTKLWRTYFQC